MSLPRPGPYINGEVDGGGLSGWSTTLPGNSRSADAAYLSAALAWQHQIDRILARHQVTNGTGTVLLDQIENEYCFASSTQNLNPSYMEALENQARADGITVPLFTNVCYPAGATWASGPGKVDVDDGAFERIIAEGTARTCAIAAVVLADVKRAMRLT